MCAVSIPCKHLGDKEYVKFDFAIRNNSTKIIDKNINKIIFSLTVLGKTNRIISVEIKNYGFSYFDVELL